LHWTRAQWTRFGEGIALVAGTWALDHRIERAALRNQRTNDFTRDVTKLGGGAGEDLAIAMAAGGWLAHDQRLRLTGIEALEADIWASQLITPLLKNAFHRRRPNGGSDSFPSSHSTSAWALATVIASRYDDHPAVPVIAYSLATSVSLARVNDHVHWASDVVAGALIGHAVGKGVIGQHLNLMPTRHGFAATWKATMPGSDGRP
jgi:hypothetical protein